MILGLAQQERAASSWEESPMRPAEGSGPRPISHEPLKRFTQSLQTSTECRSAFPKGMTTAATSESPSA